MAKEETIKSGSWGEIFFFETERKEYSQREQVEDKKTETARDLCGL